MSKRKSNLGFAVMAHMLWDDNADTVAAIEAVIGKRIASLHIETERWPEESLVVGLDGGAALRIYDSGQSCCERRFMHTDDDLADFIGASLIDVDLANHIETEHADGVTESQFLVVRTSIGVFTVVNYNEHNGDYGGFWLKAETIKEVGNSTDQEEDTKQT